MICVVLVCFYHGSKAGSTALLVSSQIGNVQKSWSSDERRTAVLFGPVVVVDVYAPDLSKSSEESERFMQVLKKVMTEDRKEGAKRIFEAGGLNGELGFLCINEDDEVKELHGPHCWYGVEADPGEAASSDIVTEFECKAMSTWLSCDCRRDEAFTHKTWEKDVLRSWIFFCDRRSAVVPVSSTLRRSCAVHGIISRCVTKEDERIGWMETQK